VKVLRDRLPWQMAGLIAAVLLSALGLFRLLVYEAPRPAPTGTVAPAFAEPAEKRPVQAMVLSVRGEVERGTASGGWSAVQPGQKVQVDELLRTGAHGATDLAIDDRSRVSLAESSEVSIRELTDTVHRFRLTRGRMAADYNPAGERMLRVESETGDAVAETRSARFSVLSSGSGIAVATAAGGVDLSARRRTVRVAAGQQSFAAQGGPPLAPVPVPTAVLLKVGNSLADESETLCAEIEGTASAGDEVTVDGVPIAIEAGGRFHHQVARVPGKRGVRVDIRDPSGREKTRTVPCSPTPAQIDDMAIRWKETP
jgi:hypothetical protein